VKLSESYEVLESVAVGMDAALDGFAGVLVELVFDGERYALVETALGSGTRLLRFRSEDRTLAYVLFEAELLNEGREPCGAGWSATLRRRSPGLRHAHCRTRGLPTEKPAVAAG
jgi:hypothetical protein